MFGGPFILQIEFQLVFIRDQEFTPSFDTTTQECHL